MNSQETKLRKAESLRSFQRLILANSVDLYGCVLSIRAFESRPIRPNHKMSHTSEL